MHIKQERRCIACRKANHQDNLIRVAKFNGNVFIDINHTADGRGAYICKEKDCINLTIKKRILNKAFKSNLDGSIYNQLGEYEQNS